MAISPPCAKCDKELEEFGAIVVSPPLGGTHDKYHLCVVCYELWLKWLHLDK